MYQPETEDLIPRCAPKPSISNVNEAIVRPSVPEISIVFTQSESLQSNSIPPATTSYAAWKKQCLPPGNYPPIAEITNSEYTAMTTRSNVYPMRTAVAVMPTINAAASQFALTRLDQSNTIRRSISVQPPCNMGSTMAHCSPTYTMTSPVYQMSNQQRRSVEHVHQPRQSVDTNVLTICAGTQTDHKDQQICEPNIGHLATKEDVAQIKTMLLGMRTEQSRLMEILHHLLISQEKKPKKDGGHKLIDVATQCDAQPTIGLLPQKRPHIRYDSIEEEDSTEEEDSYHLQKKTNVIIKSPPKIHQYQPQVFRAINLPHSDVVSSLPKPSTEQSMVMNELALKYLPNEKLSELLQELHVSPIAPQVQNTQKVYESPLKNIENYGKSPTDLSTASYKYLKKYRLLPEENNNLSPSGNVRKLHSPNQQENMLDLETIRRQPKFM